MARKGQGRRTSQTTAARSIPHVPRDPAPPCYPPGDPVNYALIGGLLMLAVGIALFGVVCAIQFRGRGRHR